ncbi:hypothetical protein DFH07DRAFT_771245 [Mycena maculata]|uniref:Uncharacterized protein n=1 Tax=Mycena maculata TaxID=230809 RepID=A0AAD7JCE6_9AGAR|nr:hypothetical protein DFH07DRAFT_771245 [Mycena maculata]
MPHHYFVWSQPLLLQLLGHTAVAAATVLLVLAPVALLLGHTYHCCTCHCSSDVASSRRQRTKFERGKKIDQRTDGGDSGDVAPSRQQITKFEGGKKVDGWTEIWETSLPGDGGRWNSSAENWEIEWMEH